MRVEKAARKEEVAGAVMFPFPSLWFYVLAKTANNMKQILIRFFMLFDAFYAAAWSFVSNLAFVLRIRPGPGFFWRH